MTRIRITYVALAEGYTPIISASSFEDLKLGLDEYYGVNKGVAECLGFSPYVTKYPDAYEGFYQYKYKVNAEDKEYTDIVKVYAVDFFPQTKYEVS